MHRYSHVWHEIEHDDNDRVSMSVTATLPIAGFGRPLVVVEEEQAESYTPPGPRPKRWRRH